MAPRARTFLVECFLPGVDEASVTAAGDRARAAADGLRAQGAEIAYTGALFVAVDEVVFHTFTASEVAVVERACAEARVDFERIVESIDIPRPLSRQRGLP